MQIIKGKYSEAHVYNDEVEQTAISQIYSFVNCSAFEGSKIRIMPDVHAGSGSVIGFTSSYSDKIVPNVVGVDISCFSGETKVSLADGRNISFLDLLEEFKSGKENYCFSFNENHEVIITKISNVSQYGSSDKICRITLDNNETIECTLDHIFYTRDGKEIKAEDLINDISLMPLYIKKSHEIDIEDISVKDKRNILKDYFVIYNPSTNKWDYVHYLADEYNRRNNIYNSRGIRHHKDFNKHNNNPTNIEIVDWITHRKIHADSAKTTNEMGISGFGAARKLHPEFFAQMGYNNMKKLWEDLDFRKSMKSVHRQIGLNFVKSEHFANFIKGSGERGRKFLIEMNINPKPFTCEICGRTIKGKSNFNKHVKSHNPDCFKCEKCGRDFKSNRYLRDHSCLNHKVIKIEIVEKETPVYCLTTNDDSHNFALSAGIFVHNCGVASVKIGKVSGLQMEHLDKFIRQNIPSGFSIRQKPHKLVSELDLDFIGEIAKATAQKIDYVLASCGTLGGGNHFMELDLDDNGDYWFTVHTGSRNFGLKIANHFQTIAKKEMAHSQGSMNGLEYLTGQSMQDYIRATKAAHEFAELSRKIILKTVVSDFFKENYNKLEVIETLHNYVDIKNGLIRKGAVAAYRGDSLIIPWNMRDGIIVGVGLGNEDWNCSAPHGAGRIMGRGEAKRSLKMEDFKDSMKDVWSSCVSSSTIDESPMAYKDPEMIKGYIKDTVDIKFTMKPVYNFKSSEEA